MRIAIFHNLPSGGAKRVLYEQVKRLSKNNSIDLYITSLDVEDFMDIRPFCKNFYVYQFSINIHVNGFSRIIKDFKNFVILPLIHMKIAEQINRKNYDVCLIHPDKYTQSPFLLNFLKIPTVYYAHETLRIAYEKELAFKERVIIYKQIYEKLTRNIRKYIDKKNAQKATKIITNSSFTKKNILKAYHLKSTVCYPGVDYDVFKPTKLKQRKILFIGSQSSIEGGKIISKKFKNLIKNLNYKLVIWRFNKNVTDDDLAEVYSTSLLTISLGFNEPFGLVTLESMACGTPIIALDEGGYRETIINGENGFLIKRSSDDLIKVIESLNKYNLKKMGSISRKYVVTKFNWHKHMIILEKELKNACKV